MRETTKTTATNLKRNLALRAAVLAAMGATATAASPAGAASLHWDADGATSAATGGAGAWTTPGTWRDGSATGTLGDWVNDGTADAHFGGTAGTVTFDSDIAAGSVNFGGSGAYTLSSTTNPITTGTIRSSNNAVHSVLANVLGTGAPGATSLTIENTNTAAGAAGATSVALKGMLSMSGFGPALTTLNIGGAADGSFTKYSAVQLWNPHVPPFGGTYNDAARNPWEIGSNINFTGNYAMLAVANPVFPNFGKAATHNFHGAVNLNNNTVLLSPSNGSEMKFFNVISSTGPDGGIVVTGFNPGDTSTAQGALVLNNSNNTYQGVTRMMGHTATQIRGQVDNFLPKTTDLVFGGPGVTNTGILNMNGMDVQVGSLTTEAGVSTQGIANSGGQAVAEGRPDGPAAVLTINGSNKAAYQNTTFAGMIGATTGQDQPDSNKQLAVVFAAPNPAAGIPGHVGSLTLTHAGSAYAMGTTINSGAVISRNTVNDFIASPVGVGPVTVNGTSASQHGTFGGSGQVIGAVTANEFAHVAPGGVGAVTPSNPLTLNAGLTLAGGSSVDFEFNGFGGDLINTTSLDVSTTTAVNLNLFDLGSGIRNGTFRLIDYDTFAGDFTKLTLVPPAGSTASYTLQQNTTDNAIELLITGAAGVITWVGDQGPTWDVNTTFNWSGPSKYFDGDFVTFDGSGAARDVVVQAAGVAPATMTVDNADYSFSGGAITASTLTKSNGGTATINNATTFTLGTTVSGGGTLAIGPTGSISGGPITVTDSFLALAADGNIAGVESVSLSNSVLRADGSFATDRPVTFGGAAVNLDTGGNNVTLAGTLGGGAVLNKYGSGTLTVSSTDGSAMTGAVNIEAGTIAIAGVNANGITPLGSTGGPSASTALVVKSGSTIEFQGVRVGYVQGTGAVNNSAGLNLVLKSGSTLKFSGESGYAVGTGGQGIKFQNFTSRAPSNVTIDTGPAGSRLAVRNFVKNEFSEADTNTNVNLVGDGIFQLASGSLGSTAAGTQYSGTWSLAMGPSGVLSVGPIIGVNNTEVLNALGYNPRGQLGETRPVTVTSGTLAVGADERNPNTSAVTNTTTGVFRSPVTLAGGNIASTGRKYTGASGSATATSATPVAARYGANITLADGTASKVLLFDPVAMGNLNGTATLTANPAGPRDVRFVTDTAPTPLASNFNWGSNTTLIADSGAETGGALSFERTSGTVSVGTNATLQVNAGGNVNLAGTVDALSDGVGNHVNVVTNGTGALNVQAGTKNVGTIGGTGVTTVTTGATLVASHVRQSSATINGTAQVRNAGPGGPRSGVSNIGTYTIGAGATLDLTTNKLVTDKPAGHATGGVYADGTVHRDVQRAYLESSWSGDGLTTSEDDAKTGLTTLAILTGEQYGSNEFAGQPITSTSTIVMYTYGGDTNFDGKLDADDYGTIDFSVLLPGVVDGYYNGDFNYDGVVNADDYGVIDFNILAQTTPFPTGGGGSATVTGVTAVPEPAAMTVLFAPLVAALGRRRRRGA